MTDTQTLQRDATALRILSWRSPDRIQDRLLAEGRHTEVLDRVARERLKVDIGRRPGATGTSRS